MRVRLAASFSPPLSRHVTSRPDEEELSLDTFTRFQHAQHVLLTAVGLGLLAKLYGFDTALHDPFLDHQLPSATKERGAQVQVEKGMIRRFFSIGVSPLCECEKPCAEALGCHMKSGI